MDNTITGPSPTINQGWHETIDGDKGILLQIGIRKQAGTSTPSPSSVLFDCWYKRLRLGDLPLHPKTNLFRKWEHKCVSNG